MRSCSLCRRGARWWSQPQGLSYPEKSDWMEGGLVWRGLHSTWDSRPSPSSLWSPGATQRSRRRDSCAGSSGCPHRKSCPASASTWCAGPRPSVPLALEERRNRTRGGADAATSSLGGDGPPPGWLHVRAKEKLLVMKRHRPQREGLQSASPRWMGTGKEQESQPGTRPAPSPSFHGFFGIISLLRTGAQSHVYKTPWYLQQCFWCHRSGSLTSVPAGLCSHVNGWEVGVRAKREMGTGERGSFLPSPSP